MWCEYVDVLIKHLDVRIVGVWTLWCKDMAAWSKDVNVWCKDVNMEYRGGNME